MKKNEVVIKERDWSGKASLRPTGEGKGWRVGGDNREGPWMSWENRVEREMSQLTELQEARGYLAIVRETPKSLSSWNRVEEGESGRK